LSSPFTATLDEFDWIYRGGAGQVFSSQWSEFLRAVENIPADRVVDRYHRALGGEVSEQRARVASAWCAWEDCLAGIPPRSIKPSPGVTLTRAVLGAHYERNGGFLRDGELLSRLHDIPPVPMHIVHGADDFLTPLQSSEAICARRPSARLTVVTEACHDPSHPALMTAIVDAGDAVIDETWRGRKSA
jgi:proline iminopeptidase